MDTTENTTKTFVSSKNVVLTLKPVSQFKLDAIRASKVEIPVPTYEMKLAGGETQTHPMDELIAKNKNRLDEWNAYIELKKKTDAEYSKTFMEFMIWEGVDVCVPDSESEWQKSNEHFGIIISDNPIERKMYYVANELLGTLEDIGDLISEIFVASQIDEEVVATMRASFRTGISRKANNRMPKKQRKVEDTQPNLE